MDERALEACARKEARMDAPAGDQSPPVNLAERLRRVWGASIPPRVRPGPKASLSREQIIDAGIALADAHGVAGLSLVRVAERLNVTTNALYRYIDSRDELNVLLQERAFGAPNLPAASDDWDENVKQWAHALRDRYLAHPWLAALAVNVPIGPNSLAWLEALLDRLDGSGLDQTAALRAATLLDGYVKSSSLTPSELAARTAPIADTQAVTQVLGSLLAEHHMPRVAALVTAKLYQPATSNDDDFTFGLNCIIAGLRQHPTPKPR
jgi:AcrR family transcriptional regulator